MSVYNRLSEILLSGEHMSNCIKFQLRDALYSAALLFFRRYPYTDLYVASGDTRRTGWGRHDIDQRRQPGCHPDGLSHSVCTRVYPHELCRLLPPLQHNGGNCKEKRQSVIER